MSATSLPEQKKVLRSRLRRLRREVAATRGEELAARAHAHLLTSPLWRQARSVALYVSLPDELDTAPLLDAAWQAGKTLYLPRVRQQYGLMDFVAVRGREELRPGPFQLLEPLDSLPGFGPEEAGTAFRPDVFIVPGLGFDRQGRRLGFGGGYYDRFLSGVRAQGGDAGPCPFVGLCFHCQLQDALPAEPWDERMTHICTDREWLCL